MTATYSSSTEKNYVGSGWRREFNNGSTVVNISLDKAKLLSLPTRTDQNGKEWIRLTVSSLRTPSEKNGATHSIYEDTYVKDPSQNTNSANGNTPKADDTQNINTSVPF
jgi:hypothetical protein